LAADAIRSYRRAVRARAGLVSGAAFLGLVLGSSAAPCDEGAADARDAPLLRACGSGDAVLADVAAFIARERLARGSDPDPEDVITELRERGSTLPWTRFRVMTGARLERSILAEDVGQWAERTGGRARRACGISSATDADGREVVVAVVAPLLATVRKIPRNVRRGTWVTVDATLLAPGQDGHVVLLGPRGLPRTLLGSSTDRHVMARFAADQAGRFVAQVVADQGNGPLPVAEVDVTVGTEPRRDEPAPGEDTSSTTDERTLFAMLGRARETEGLPPLHLDRELSKIAVDHAAKLARRGVLAHDVGDGDPSDRVDAAGLVASEVGENAARATTLPLLHRALWRSPSHRANLLSQRFTHAGVGVARDARGTAYAVELFLRR
jgi:uncharacterized protein YkwD